MSNKAEIIRGLIDRAMSADQRIAPVPPADGDKQKYCLAISRGQWEWLHRQVTPRLSKVDIVRGLIAQAMGGAGSDMTSRQSISRFASQNTFLDSRANNH